MSGRTDSFAQLALVDAVVFFLAAAIVSELLISLGCLDEFDSDLTSEPVGYDPDELSEAFLRSSLGVGLTVKVSGHDLRLTERDPILDCLLLEAHAIALGEGESDFSVLNIRLGEILNSVLGPFVEPSLRLVDITNGTPTVLVSLPSEWGEAESAYSASTEISDGTGRAYLIQLRLVPVSSAQS